MGSGILVKDMWAYKDPVTLENLASMASSGEMVLNEIRSAILEPYPRKTPPEFSANQAAALCGLTRTKLRNAEVGLDTSRGYIKEGDSSKTYSLKETIELVDVFNGGKGRPEGKKGKTLVIANYKGGVGKTTSAVSIAQGLTLRGLRCLLVDLDPQGSATSLFGISPQLEIEESDTIMPFIHQDEDAKDLRYAIRETYWHNLDIIPSNSFTLGAEFVIPSKNLTADDYDYFQQIAIGIEPLKDLYDVIIFDTSPSLGFLTQNAMSAADAVLAPCPLDALDFASLTQFWSVFMEIALHKNIDKTYDFVGIFISMAKMEKDEFATSNIVKEWLKKAFQDKLWDITLPDSSVVKTASSVLKTVYDVTDKREVEKASFKRYKEPMDQLVDMVVSQFNQAWSKS